MRTGCLHCGKRRCPDIAFYRAASEREKTLMRSGLSKDDIEYLRGGDFLSSEFAEANREALRQVGGVR